MIAKRIIAAALILALPATALAHGGVRIAVGFGVPFYPGPYFYGRPYDRPYFGPAIYVAPPPPVYVVPAPGGYYYQPGPLLRAPSRPRTIPPANVPNPPPPATSGSTEPTPFTPPPRPAEPSPLPPLTVPNSPTPGR